MAKHPITAQWGFDMQQGDDLTSRFGIAPANRTGNLAIQFEVADDYAPCNRACGLFLSNYPDLEAFRLGDARLMNRKATAAIFTGR